MPGPGSAEFGAASAIAAVGHSNIPRMCLMYVHDWLGIGARYPTAIAAWAAARDKHARDANPPAGVPVFFLGAERPGHVALSIGGGKIVSTDWPHAGHIGQTTITELASTWHHTYLGWTGDLNGKAIAGVGSASTNNTTATPIDNPIPGVDQLGQLTRTIRDVGKAVDYATNPHNWLRIAYFIAGAALCLFALWKTAPATHGLTTKTVKKVGEYASAAKS
jgi:hypothetical protein